VRRADDSSRVVVPTVVHRSVWYRNLKIGDAVARIRPQLQGKIKSCMKYSALFNIQQLTYVLFYVETHGCPKLVWWSLVSVLHSSWHRALGTVRCAQCLYCR